jgi:hypothetical protein
LNVNFEKTKIVHFRNPSVPPTNEIFLLSEKQLGVVSKYQYLGLLLTEFLDYNEMALHHVLRISNSNCKSFSFSAINTICIKYFELWM